LGRSSSSSVFYDAVPHQVDESVRARRAMRRDPDAMAVNWSEPGRPSSQYRLYSPRPKPQTLGGVRLGGRRFGAVTTTSPPAASALDRLNLRKKEQRGPVGSPGGSTYRVGTSVGLSSVVAAKKFASRAADKKNLLKTVELLYDSADHAARTTRCGAAKCSGVGEKLQTLLYDYINALDLKDYARGVYDAKYKATVWAVAGACVTVATGLHGLAASAALYAASWFWARACPRDATAAPADETVVQQLGKLRATRYGAAALEKLLKARVLWALVVIVGKVMETRMQAVIGGLVDVPALLEKLVKTPANRVLLVDFVFGKASNLKPLLLAAAAAVDVAVLRQVVERYEGAGQSALAGRASGGIVRMRSRTPGR
jgi:hypothetical protein